MVNKSHIHPDGDDIVKDKINKPIWNNHRRCLRTTIALDYYYRNRALSEIQIGRTDFNLDCLKKSESLDAVSIF